MQDILCIRNVRLCRWIKPVDVRIFDSNLGADLSLALLSALTTGKLLFTVRTIPFSGINIDEYFLSLSFFPDTRGESTSGLWVTSEDTCLGSSLSSIPMIRPCKCIPDDIIAAPLQEYLSIRIAVTGGNMADPILVPTEKIPNASDREDLKCRTTTTAPTHVYRPDPSPVEKLKDT